MVSEVAAVAKNWWLFVVLGSICLIAGVLAIVWPDKTLLAIGIFAGVYLIMAAIMEIVEAIFGEPGGRTMSAILGVISLIAGLILLRRPGTSLLAIVIALGIFLVAEGVIRVVRAFEAREHRGWSIALGTFDVLMGILILAWPGIGLVTLAVFFALTMLFRGAFAVVAGFQLRKLRHVDDPPPVHTAAVA